VLAGPATVLPIQVGVVLVQLQMQRHQRAEQHLQLDQHLQRLVQVLRMAQGMARGAVVAGQ